MAQAATPPRPGSALRERLRALGQEIGAREREHAAEMARASAVASALRELVADGLAAFHEASRASGAAALEIVLEPTRPDDKHLRAFQFLVRRGRHAGLVTVKSRGEVILVGPFQQGKQEGPCQRFPIGADAEIEAALGEFLERFIEQAATP